MGADPARAAHFAADYGVDDCTKLEAVLDRSDVDVVCVCIPSGLHAEIGVQAASAGKHLVVEKPIEIALEAADRRIAACRHHGVKLTAIFQHRFDAGVERLRAAGTSGHLGRLILGDAIVKWYRSPEYYESAGWRATWDLDGGGALMNQGVHYVDLLQWMMGRVDRVVARCATAVHAIPVEDVALAFLTFSRGAVGVIEVSTAVYPGFPERLEITGTHGSAGIEQGQVVAWELKRERGEVGPYGLNPRRGHPQPSATPDPPATIAGHRAQLVDFLDAIGTDRDPAVTGEEARKSLEIILSIYESARTGREITLPL